MALANEKNETKVITSIQKLYALTEKPMINQISLKLLAKYYEYYLSKYEFIYDIENKETKEKSELRVKFEKDKFCHLFGIEKTAKFSVSRKELKNYSGELGWENIMNDSLTIKLLKGLNKSKFNSNKSKYIYFYLFPKIVLNPQAIFYDKNKVSKDTDVECDIMFYNKGIKVIAHVGLSKYDNEECYFPRTFLIENINKNNDGETFIKGQDKINVKKIKRT